MATVPWDWIVDETRSIDSFLGSPTLRQWLLDTLPLARRDPWNRESPIILTESRSLAGVLRGLCQQYAVQIASTNGQCGGFLRTDIAPILRPSHRVFYLGDYDLSGNSIEQNARRVLVRLAGELQWERLALTQAQVEEYSLPTLVKHDRRFKDGGTHEAVETEALS
jgi:hypothetical protein